MTKRLALITLLFAAPIFAAAAVIETLETKSNGGSAASRVVEWLPAGGPTDLPALPDTDEWKNVWVAPGATASYPIDETPSHYYAARRTGSAPLQVMGSQFEKFLFYRGIASFTPPVSAKPGPDGKIEVANLGDDVIPDIVL